MPIDEGYIKFDLQWEKSPAPGKDEIEDLIAYRNKCFQHGFIGVYAESGIGYGNISKRHKNSDRFIISGTQTGLIPRLKAEHFTLVTHVDFKKNQVWCKGPVKASAESLTHAMFYRLSHTINSVIHIHHKGMWEALIHKKPTTSEKIAYGTVEMCKEIERLYQTSKLPTEKLLVMGGHVEGIISFGITLSEAFENLLQLEAKTNFYQDRP